MAPFAKENHAESGVKKWLSAKNAKSSSRSQISGESLWQAGKGGENGDESLNLRIL